MKKILLVILAISMLASLIACGSSATATNTSEAAPEKHVLNEDAEGVGDGDHTDTIYFTINDYYNMESSDTRLMISHFETYEQVESYTCGPSSAYMVLNYFDKEEASKWSELSIAEACGSTGGGVGTSAEQLANFFTEELGWHADYYMSHEKTFDSLQNFIESLVKWELEDGHPIIVDWCISSGHWTTIIGYDNMGTPSDYTDDVLIMADSGDSGDHYQDGYMVFGAQRFFRMWKESTPFDGEEVYKQEYVVAYPEGK